MLICRRAIYEGRKACCRLLLGLAIAVHVAPKPFSMHKDLQHFQQRQRQQQQQQPGGKNADNTYASGDLRSFKEVKLHLTAISRSACGL